MVFTAMLRMRTQEGILTRSIQTAILAAWCTLAFNGIAQTWAHYGGDAGGTRYSSLKQINRENVGQLKVAWTYNTGALKPESPLNRKSAFEATPIMVDGALYLSTPFDQVIALDPATGTERWKF